MGYFKPARDENYEYYLLSLEECVDFVKQGRFHLIRVYVRFNSEIHEPEEAPNDYGKWNEFVSYLKMKHTLNCEDKSSYWETGDDQHRIGINESTCLTEEFLDFEGFSISENTPLLYYPPTEKACSRDEEECLLSTMETFLQDNQHYYHYRFVHEEQGLYGYEHYLKDEWGEMVQTFASGDSSSREADMFVLYDTRGNKTLFSLVWMHPFGEYGKRYEYPRKEKWYEHDELGTSKDYSHGERYQYRIEWLDDGSAIRIFDYKSW